jgi:3,4-dihydroxy 2-butanone 4-phosphate synthase
MIGDFSRGKPVLIYDADGREAETDLVIGAQFVTPAVVRRFRKDGGGLICMCVTDEAAARLGLMRLGEIYEKAGVFRGLKADDLPYDERSSFSITINSRNTFTGIPDNDRARTAAEFAALVARGRLGDFGKLFRSPGHVPLLIGARGLLKSRQGHTELSLALADMAGITPVTLICEMLGDNGKSLGKGAAKAYAKKNRLAFIEGKDLIGEWKGLKK